MCQIFRGVVVLQDMAMQTSPTSLQGQEAQMGVLAAVPNPTQNDTSMLIKMAAFFMSLAHNAAQGWGADSIPVRMYSCCIGDPENAVQCIGLQIMCFWLPSNACGGRENAM